MLLVEWLAAIQRRTCHILAHLVDGSPARRSEMGAQGVFQKESVCLVCLCWQFLSSSFRMLISEAPGPCPLSRLEVWRGEGYNPRDMALLRVFKTLSPRGRREAGSGGLAGWWATIATSVPTWWLCVPTAESSQKPGPKITTKADRGVE